jgi:hypothetical protein
MDFNVKNEHGAYKLIEVLSNGMYKLVGYLNNDTIVRKSTSCVEKICINIQSECDTPPIYLDGATVASGLNANGIGWKIKIENDMCVEYENGVKI